MRTSMICPVGVSGLLLAALSGGCTGAAAEKPAAAATGGSSADEIAQQQAIQPDRIDEIRQLCTRKASTAVPLCWSREYDRTHNQKFSAQVTLLIIVSTTGTAQEVKVVADQGGTPELEQCLIQEARDWTYPGGSVSAPVECSFFLQSSM